MPPTARLQGDRVVANFASTSTLAQQIIAGSPCDVFISANEKWMDHVEEKGAVIPGTRRDFLKNTLVLITPKNASAAIAAPSDLLGPACPHLALGEPNSVPAGIYAKQSLTSLGLWDRAQDRLLPALDVRTALAYVERGEAACGIVYSTDAKISNKVKTVLTLPADSHTPIVYPIARTANGKEPEGGGRFMAFLDTPKAAAVFEKHGFLAISPGR
ncbi:MAG: molybdate ABC transporter substrate-binding protein [Deltaproteobacteria bacterium]|nr:molybdate ABC transporter substrate-binding protein [Deltaproteobacteria bacterium]